MNKKEGPSGVPSGLCITLDGMCAQAEGAEIALTVTLSCGENRETRRLVLRMEQYCELEPRRGCLSEAELEALERADALCRAIRSGENLLYYGANTAKGLCAKLIKRGHDRETAQAAADHLQARGALNEARELEGEVNLCLRKLWGKERIRAKLWSKGYSKESLACLPELLCEVDFAENCAKLVKKRYGGLPAASEERRRITAGLCRYGYSMSEIKEAYRMLSKGEA